MDTVSRLRLSLGFLSTAFAMLFGTDRGRRAPLSPGAVEILYTSYFSTVCMGDIAGMLGVTPSSAADLVNRMEREGYVRRVPDPANRRRVLVEPTEKGELWVLETEERLYGLLESCLARLSAGERETFADLCARFSGVEDDLTFIASVAAVRRDRGAARVPLVRRRDGRLLRLEEAVDERYGAIADERGTNRVVHRMFETRIPETTDGIQDECTVEQYDEMQRGLRDQGHLPVDDLVRYTRTGDRALEIGPGPGYYGLEWLKQTRETSLVGLEISPAMIRVAETNAQEYGLADLVAYREGNALRMPFPDGCFDLVFSNGSLHEWEDATTVFAEALRLLRPGGRVMVTDLRRDLSPEIFGFMCQSCRGPEVRAGFETSVRAAYTKEELEALLAPLPFSSVGVVAHPYGLVVAAEK
jgi:ubiquinone/menaquinone biosynthesis C-methylase UbiE/DNA-binding MarR family transcriptional regulator